MKRKRAHRSDETFSCPNCGADVPVAARACPECGSDEETGWSQDTMYDDLDLPDPDYGRDEDPARPNDRFWKVVAIVVLVLVAILVLLRVI
jgi:hypothetical protein